jgi:hypothetical protein
MRFCCFTNILALDSFDPFLLALTPQTYTAVNCGLDMLNACALHDRHFCACIRLSGNAREKQGWSIEHHVAYIP